MIDRNCRPINIDWLILIIFLKQDSIKINIKFLKGTENCLIDPSTFPRPNITCFHAFSSEMYDQRDSCILNSRFNHRSYKEKIGKIYGRWLPSNDQPFCIASVILAQGIWIPCKIRRELTGQARSKYPRFPKNFAHCFGNNRGQLPFWQLLIVSGLPFYSLIKVE